ncbi:MAG: hypothetical protein PHV74_11880 [Dehalococcoidia bacterium]|nr:hypothetical protein [Dehalococcoidia bacterium]
MPISPENLQWLQSLDETKREEVLSRVSPAARREAEAALSPQQKRGKAWWDTVPLIKEVSKVGNVLDEIPGIEQVAHGAKYGINWYQGNVVQPIEAGVWRAGVGMMPGQQSGEANIKEMGVRGAFKTAKLPTGMKTAMDIGLDPLTYVPVGAGLKGLKTGLEQGLKTGLKQSVKPMAKFEAGQQVVKPVEALNATATGFGELPQGIKGTAIGTVTQGARQVELPPSALAFKEAMKKATPAIKAGQATDRTAITLGRSKQAAAAERVFRAQKGVAGIEESSKAMAGALKSPTFQLEGLADSQLDDVANWIQVHPNLDEFEKKQVLDTYKQILDGVAPTGREQIKQFGSVFGEDVIVDLLRKRGFKEGAVGLAVDILNFPRAVMAAFDVSAPLRQGLFFQAGRPKEAFGAYVPMLKAFAKEKNMVAVHEAIEDSPYAKTFLDHGGYIAPMPTKTAKYALSKGEESFATRLANKIPGITHSNRAFVTYLNKLRMDTFSNVVNSWERAGKAITAKDLDDLALLVNLGTGRGRLGPLNKYGAELSTVLFSPRLQMARVELPTMLVRATPKVRQEFIRNSVADIAAIGGLLATLKMAGVIDVELDPRSSDFGKARVGNTRFDVWGGSQQYIRFIATMVDEQAKAAGGGGLYPVERTDAAWRFLQGKASPAVSLGLDLINEQDFIGDEFGIYDIASAKTARERLMPMLFQDVLDTLSQSGPLMAVSTGIPGAFGVGISSYGKGTWQEVRQMRDKYNTTGKEWSGKDGLTYSERREIETAHPDLKALTDKLETDIDQFKGSPTEKALMAIEQSKETAFATGLAGLANAKQQGMSWQDYNDQRDKLMTERFAVKSVVSAMEPIFSDKTAEQIEADVKKTRTSMDNAMQEYKDKLSDGQIKDENGMTDWDATFAQADKYLKSLDSETRSYIQFHQHDWIQDLPKEVQAVEYRRLEMLKIMKPYWEVRTKVYAGLNDRQKQVLADFDKKRRTVAAKGNLDWEKFELQRNLGLATVYRNTEQRISQLREQMRQMNPVLDRTVKEWYLRWSDLGG